MGGASALRLIYRGGDQRFYPLVGGALVGLGFVATCFTDRRAMIMPDRQRRYDDGMVALSFAVAAGFFIPARWILHRFYHGGSVSAGREKLAFSIPMASAIVGMDYVGMASVIALAGNARKRIRR